MKCCVSRARPARRSLRPPRACANPVNCAWHSTPRRKKSLRRGRARRGVSTRRSSATTPRAEPCATASFASAIGRSSTIASRPCALRLAAIDRQRARESGRAGEAATAEAPCTLGAAFERPSARFDEAEPVPDAAFRFRAAASRRDRGRDGAARKHRECATSVEELASERDGFRSTRRSSRGQARSRRSSPKPAATPRPRRICQESIAKPRRCARGSRCWRGASALHRRARSSPASPPTPSLLTCVCSAARGAPSKRSSRDTAPNLRASAKTRVRCKRTMRHGQGAYRPRAVTGAARRRRSDTASPRAARRDRADDRGRGEGACRGGTPAFAACRLARRARRRLRARDSRPSDASAKSRTRTPRPWIARKRIARAAERECRGIEAELENVEGSRAVPSLAAIAAARGERETLWERLRDRALRGRAPGARARRFRRRLRAAGGACGSPRR